jgi:hypothetical protein
MNVMPKSNPTLTQSGLLAVLLQRQRYKVIESALHRAHRKPRRLRTQNVIPRRAPFLFTHAKQPAAIIAALAFLGLWFGLSTYHAPRLGYPYYDTHKPVPPWGEPAPLGGNHDRGEENR